MPSVMIFSGTTEGRELSQSMAGKGIDVHVRVATEYGAEVMGYDDRLDVKVGSCGGAEGIAKVIAELGCDMVIDATHPYALNITAHIREACGSTGIEYVRLKRSESGISVKDTVIVESVDQAVGYLKGTTGRILVTTGSNDIARYTEINDFENRVVARVLPTKTSVGKCRSAGIPERNIIAAQGPFSEEENYRTVTERGISYMVTKDSGKAGGFEDKINAARRAGITVILLRRPEESGLSYGEVVEKLEQRYGISI